MINYRTFFVWHCGCSVLSDPDCKFFKGIVEPAKRGNLSQHHKKYIGPHLTIYKDEGFFVREKYGSGICKRRFDK